jgi:putative ABC transport system permease protein
LRLIAVGIAVGVIASLASARLVSSLLYGIRSTHAVTLAAASCVLATVVLTATYIPARAMRVDPMLALRYE